MPTSPLPPTTSPNTSPRSQGLNRSPSPPTSTKSYSVSWVGLALTSRVADNRTPPKARRCPQYLNQGRRLERLAPYSFPNRQCKPGLSAVTVARVHPPMNDSRSPWTTSRVRSAPHSSPNDAATLDHFKASGRHRFV